MSADTQARRMTLDELRTLHPMPWRYLAAGKPGSIVVFDTNNREVPLFTILELVVTVTAKLAQAPIKPQEQSTA